VKIEHVAFNVKDPLSMGRWYVEHLGFKVKRRIVESPYTHFLADDSGTVMIEIYGNGDAPVPQYRERNPLELHLALASNDLEADIRRLTAAGATQVGEILSTPEGDRLAMLQDPWGFAIQLVKRSSPMV
jgi:catechol 2,3-dioxygenase-like lactoylglutathione lyase family enzyme